MLICAIAIGSFVADFWFLDFFGPLIVVIALPLLPMAIVGAFLVVRRAGGPIGWLLGAAGALLQLVLLSNAYGYRSSEPGTALPGGELATWLGSFIWIVSLGMLVSAMVRFPDGRPPRPHIRRPAVGLRCFRPHRCGWGRARGPADRCALAGRRPARR